MALRRVSMLPAFALLTAALLFGVNLHPETAEAQSSGGQISVISAGPDGSYIVPYDWPLVPADIGPGQTFRLLFVSTTQRNAASTNIADYNTHVQTAARTTGHTAIRPFAETFKVLGSTSAVDARDNTDTNTSSDGSGEPIYFLNGQRIANNYADFYDGNWNTVDSRDLRTEAGNQWSPPNPAFLFIYTGSNADGTKHATNPLGTAGNVRNDTWGYGLNNVAMRSTGVRDRNETRPFYGLSPVFRVTLDADFEDAEVHVAEGGTATLMVKLPSAPSADVVVNLARQSGSADIGIIPTSRTFTTTNWNVPQLFLVNPAQDADRLADGGYLRLSATGYQNALAIVYVRDDELTGPVVTGGLPTAEGVSRVAGAIPYEEAADSDNDANTQETIDFNVSVPANVSANLSVCVNVAEHVGDRVTTDISEPIAVTIPSGSRSATLSVAYANDSVDTPSSVVTFQVVTPAFNGCTSSANYRPGTDFFDADRYDVARIVDDERTTSSIALTGHDEILEIGGGPTNGATEFTVSLNRTLVKGEVASVPVTVSGAVVGEPVIRLKGGDKGVTGRMPSSSLDFIVTFTGPSDRTATLTIKANTDSVSDDNEAWTVLIAAYNLARFSAIPQVNMDGGIDRTGVLAQGSFTIRVREEASVRDFTATISAVPIPNPNAVNLQDAYGAQMVRANGEARLRITLNRALLAGQQFTVPLQMVAIRQDSRAYGQAGHSFYVGTAIEGGVAFGSSNEIVIGRPPAGENVAGSVRINGLTGTTPSITLLGGGTKTATFRVRGNIRDTSGPDRVFAIGIGAATNQTLVRNVTLTSTPGSETYPHLALRTNVRTAADVLVHSMTYLKWALPSDGVYYYRDHEDGLVRSVRKYKDPQYTPANYHFDRALTMGGGVLDYRIWFTKPPLTTMTLVVRPTVTGRVKLSKTQDGTYTDTLSFTIGAGDPRNPDRCEDPVTGKWNGNTSWRCSVRVWVKPLNPSDTPQCATIQHQLQGSRSGYHNRLNAANDMQIRMHRYDTTANAVSRAPSCAYLTPIVTDQSGFNWSGQGTTRAHAEAQACLAANTCTVVEDDNVAKLRRLSRSAPMRYDLLTRNRQRGEGMPQQEVVAEGFAVGEAQAEVVQILHEGEETTLTLRLSRAISAHQKATFQLSFAGADVGDDFALSLDVAENPNVTVDATNHLGTATPRLTMQGVQEMTLTLSALKDNVEEGAERLTISVDEAYYDDGQRTWVPRTIDPINLDILDAVAEPLPEVDKLSVLELTGSTAALAWPAVEGAASYVLVWYSPDSPGNGSEEGTATDPYFQITGLEPDTFYSVALLAMDDEGVMFQSSSTGFTTKDASVKPNPTPVVSISAAGGVTEGGSATFSIKASPAPASPLTVKLDLSQSGDYLNPASVGAKTVTIPTSGTLTYAVATVDDAKDEPDGSVTATLSAGTGYTISSTSGAATVAVSDNDVGTQVSISGGTAVTEGGNATFTITVTPAPAAALTVNLAISQSGSYIASGDAGAKTVTVPTSGTATYTVATVDDALDEADGSVTATLSAGTGYGVSPTGGAATVSVADNDVTPVVSISAGSGVTEGGNAAFTITVSPAPAAALTVNLAVSQSGSYIASGDAGAKTVTVPTSGTTTYTVATVDDLIDEADGSVTATLSAGAGYGVSSSSGAATVSVEDNDLPPPQASITAGSNVTEGGNAVFTITVTPAPAAALTVNLAVSQSGSYIAASDAGAKTVTVPTSGTATYTVATIDDAIDEADGSVTATLSAGTGYAVSSSSGAATVSVEDNDVTPVVSIAAGSGVTEGGNATFTITASPAPAAALTVKLSVSQSGSYIASGDAGAKTVTVPTSGTATYTVATVDDSIDEADGSVTATLNAGTGYAVSSSSGAATVSVEDNDVTPVVSISGGSGVTEGGNAVFTITVTPAPGAALTVKLNVSQSGDYIASGDAGAKTVTVPTSGTATYTVATVDDAIDEADGSVTATLNAGTGYAVSSSSGAATVSVEDNDVTPVVSISGGSGVTEGGNAVFTITVTPAPGAALTVKLNVSQSGDYIASGDAGAKTVTVPTSGTATYTVATVDDAIDEPNGSVTATLSAGTGYAVSSTGGAATVSVADNDDPPPVPPVDRLTVVEVTDTSATLAWPAHADAGSYVLIWYSPDFPGDADSKEHTTTDTHFQITELEPDTFYSVAVLLLGKDGVMFKSLTIGFTTESTQ